MSTAATRVEADIFDKAAAECRWSERSLSVVRALLVDGERLTEVAARYDMKPGQAGVLKTRFMEKVRSVEVKKVSADAFMLKQRPEGDAELEPLKAELLKLKRNKYSIDQIIHYLSENGIEATESTVTNFFKRISKDGNSRTR